MTIENIRVSALKRIFASFAGIGVLFVLTVTAASAQNLGNVAREARQKKSGKQSQVKVITNDSLNIPPRAESEEKAAGNEAAKETESAAPASKPDVGKDDKDKTPTSPAEEQKKLGEEWKSRLDKQKEEIALLQRELDVLDRESKLRIANFYADAGTRLRDEAKFAEEDRRYQQELENKRKAIADAQKKLEDMREEARRAGVLPGYLN